MMDKASKAALIRHLILIVVGVVLISVLINGMTILNWNIYLQYIVRGAILIGSLVLMAYRDKYRD